MKRNAAWSFFVAFYSLLGTSHASTADSATPSSQLKPDVCAFEPGAKVSDACASYIELDKLNARLHPAVRQLVSEADFFSYYRLNLYNKVCPFWSDENGVCGNIACAVTTLENEKDIPPTWRAEELSRLNGPKAHHPDRQEQQKRPQKPLQGELGANVDESCVVEYDDECDERDYCVPEDESTSAKGDYVSLVDNPERFTGYAGEGARQVWEAIYRENCFSKPSNGNGQSSSVQQTGPFAALSGAKAQASMDLRQVLKEHGRQQSGSIESQMEFDDECVEKRVFYRIISGMHASISTHLCYDYLNQTTGQWGPNVECYKERIERYPERLSNLYFNYALVARAVAKLKDHVQDYTFCTGDPAEDARTKRLITALAQDLPAGTEIFDEKVMFKNTGSGSSGPTAGVTLKEDFRNRFRNVSRIMDCVGCDKCRLWGKLQTAGYGTALKVLFEFGQDDAAVSKPLLRRTELIALINTLDKISQALRIIGEFRTMVLGQQRTESAARMSAEKPMLADEEDDLELKDGYDPLKGVPQDDGVVDAFWTELGQVWGACTFIVTQWVTLPAKLWNVAMEEVARGWWSFVGRPVPPRSWRFEWKREHDEL